MNTLKIHNRQAKMIAHRGLSGLETENTCAAFVAAGNRESYYGIETDVHVTADGQYVILHDDSTGRVCGDDLSVEGSTFETLRQLRLLDRDGKRGRTDLRIPELTEYVKLCKRYEKNGVLELKNAFTEQQICEIVRKIKEVGYGEGIVYISFCLENLVTLRKHFPECRAQYLAEKFTPEVFAAMRAWRLGLDIYYPNLDREAVERIHAAGLEVNCWTVDNAADGERMAELGVDYITSNILEGCD